MKVQAICILTGIALLSSCATKRFVKFEQATAMNYTLPSLEKFASQTQGLSVVVRDPNATGSLSTAGRSNRVCAILERELMKTKKYMPRDRQLFETVVSKLPEGSSYKEIYQKTGVDIIFEVTSFGEDTYTWTSTAPTGFWRRGGLSTATFSGFHIEIKVILMKDNLIAGTYKYFYTPCTKEGCEIISQHQNLLIYRPAASDVVNPIVDHTRIMSQEEKDEMMLSNFISKVVLPKMFTEMGER